MTTGNNLTPAQLLAEINANLPDNQIEEITPAIVRQVLADISASFASNAAGGGGSANPSAQVGTSAVAGTALTFMTSDSAPAINLGMAPTWTGTHIWTKAPSVQVTGGTANLFIDDVTGTNNAEVQFQAAGVSKWELGKDGSNNFFIFDDVGGSNVVGITGGASGQFFFARQAIFTATSPQIAVGANGGNVGQINLNGSTSGQANLAAGPAGSLTATSANTKNITLQEGTNGSMFIAAALGAAIANQVTITPAATTVAPVLAATGSDTNITLQLKGKGTGGAAVLGTSTNDSAATGYVGELLTATQSTPQALTVGTPLTLTSISLTPGDWDVSGLVNFTNFNNISSATLSSAHWASLSTNTNTLDATDTRQVSVIYPPISSAPTANFHLPVGPSRFSVSSNTTVFLVAQFSGGGTITFGSGTNVNGFGTIRARRVR